MLYKDVSELTDLCFKHTYTRIVNVTFYRAQSNAVINIAKRSRQLDNFTIIQPTSADSDDFIPVSAVFREAPPCEYHRAPAARPRPPRASTRRVGVARRLEMTG